MNLIDLAYIPIAFVTAPWWASKPREEWAQRFGHVPPLADGGHERERPRILLHAVSVGEVNALRGLVPLLTTEARVIVSSTTDTGIARARALFADTCDVVRYPLDASFAVERFLRAVRPDAAALVELELWPNFLRQCSRRNIPVCVINGRLSDRSIRGYRRIRRFASPMFASLAFAGVQDEVYASRFEEMGVAPNACLIVGSMKWDAAQVDAEPQGAPELRDAMGIASDRPLIVAGSTGPGEEALLYRACPPDVQLLCAPRKPERFDEAARALPGCVRRSTGAGGRGADRFLLDTIGELRAAYALADIVVIGRSFGSLHGSDPIEAAALGRAIVIGPRVSDFARIVASLEEAGGIVRASPDSLGDVLRRLVHAPEERVRLGNSARNCVLAMQGASERCAGLVLSMLDGARPPAEDRDALLSRSATAGV